MEPILSPSTLLFGTFQVQHGQQQQQQQPLFYSGGKSSSFQLLWIVNSGFTGATCTSMHSYNRSVTASQAKCLVWLLTALKGNLFPEGIWNVLFVIRKWCLNSYGKYLGTVSWKEPVLLVKLQHIKQLTQYPWYHRQNRHLALIEQHWWQWSNILHLKWAQNSFCKWNGMRPFGPVAIHSTSRNVWTSAQNFWLSGLHPESASLHGTHISLLQRNFKVTFLCSKLITQLFLVVDFFT